MPWPCTGPYVSRDAACEANDGKPPRIGAIWYDHRLLAARHRPSLSQKYLAQRAPLVIALPGYDFPLDALEWKWDGTKVIYHGNGWTISGDPPKITVTPSINLYGIWHGHITNGVVTKDAEGRVFAGEPA